MSSNYMIQSTERTRPATFRWGECVPAPSKIVFCNHPGLSHRNDPTWPHQWASPVRTKVSTGITGPQLTAVTYVKLLGNIQTHIHIIILNPYWVSFFKKIMQKLIMPNKSKHSNIEIYFCYSEIIRLWRYYMKLPWNIISIYSFNFAIST